MDKSLLAIVNNIALWKGNAFTLAALIAAAQKEIDRDKLIAAGLVEAAEAL